MSTGFGLQSATVDIAYTLRVSNLTDSGVSKILEANLVTLSNRLSARGFAGIVVQTANTYTFSPTAKPTASPETKTGTNYMALTLNTEYSLLSVCLSVCLSLCLSLSICFHIYVYTSLFPIFIFSFCFSNY